MSDNMPHITLFFGSALVPSFYEGLVRDGVMLGLVKNSAETLYTSVPQEFILTELVDFRMGVEAITEAIRTISRNWAVDAIVNVDERHVALWAQVCSELQLPYITYEAARVLRNKSLMRELFLQLDQGESCRYAVARSENDAQQSAQSIGFPVVVKPNNLYSSFLVRICRGPDDVQQAFNRAYNDLRQRPEGRLSAFEEPREVLIEEYVRGTNHSVDCLIVDGAVHVTPVVDVLTGADLGGRDFHHFARITPSLLSEVEQSACQELAARAAKLFSMQRGALHIEMIQTPAGPKIIEVGARPGANRSTLLYLAFGINLMGLYRKALAGKELSTARSKTASAAYVTPFPQRKGRICRIKSLSAVRRLKSFEALEVGVKVGDEITPREEGGSAPIRITLHSDSVEELRTDLASLQELSRKMFFFEDEDLIRSTE